MGSFICKWSVIAVCHSQSVQAHDFTTIADNIDTIAFDGCRRGNASLRPIKVRIFLAFWDNKLPKELARFLLKTHEHAAVALMVRITRRAIIRPNVNASIGDNRGRMRLSAELRRPFDMLTCLYIKRLRKSFFIRNHVASPRLA